MGRQERARAALLAEGACCASLDLGPPGVARRQRTRPVNGVADADLKDRCQTGCSAEVLCAVLQLRAEMAAALDAPQILVGPAQCSTTQRSLLRRFATHTELRNRALSQPPRARLDGGNARSQTKPRLSLPARHTACRVQRAGRCQRARQGALGRCYNPGPLARASKTGQALEATVTRPRGS